MSNIYSNLPPSNASNEMVKAFDAYTNQPLEIEVSTLNAMKGFFGQRGFDKESSQNISVIIIKQAKIDNYNPMTILDTLKGLDNVEISALVSEILNYNRFKSSFLGYSRANTVPEDIKRNILA